MQICTIKSGNSGLPQLGLIANDRFFSFNELAAQDELAAPKFTDIQSYLEASSLHHSLALQYHRLAERMPAEAGLPIAEAEFLPAIPAPTMLLDFALTPKHLALSAQTLLLHEFSGLKRLIARQMLKRKLKAMKQSRDYAYYIGNHLAISGPGDTLHWPSYTSYLDIEPELAIVTGDTRQPIAGYTILNDISARDVQMPELNSLSLTRSKHFPLSNGIGPFLALPDGQFHPLDLAVDVRVGNRYHWQGSTAEYSAQPEEVVRYLQSIFDIKPGMVIGLGTIPGCCGLDHDQWAEPGDRVAISIDKLGTLHQQLPCVPDKIEASRWGKRF